MARTLATIRIRRKVYFVVPVAESDADLLPARYILHDRGRKYLLVPDARRPDRLVVVAPVTYSGRYRPPPFPGTWFAEDGNVVIAPADA